jgi:hypothetical protein
LSQAIPPLTQALAIDTNNYSALLNRAIAIPARRQAQEAAQRDYEGPATGLPNRSPDLTSAWLKSPGGGKDTNAAVRDYQLYLANAPNQHGRGQSSSGSGSRN